MPLERIAFDIGTDGIEFLLVSDDAVVEVALPEAVTDAGERAIAMSGERLETAHDFGQREGTRDTQEHEYTVEVVRHDHEGVEFEARMVFGEAHPGVLDHGACRIVDQFASVDMTKQWTAIGSAQGNEVRPSLRVIVGTQPERSARWIGSHDRMVPDDAMLMPVALTT